MAYTYNAIGNILTRIETIGATPSATYTYAYAGTSYANPHAVTSIAAKTTPTGPNNYNIVHLRQQWKHDY